MAVLQSELEQPSRRHPAVEQALHLVGHALVEALAQTVFDAGYDHLAGQCHAEHAVLHRGHLYVGVGVVQCELLYLEGAHQAVAGLGVGVVVQLDERCQASGELLVGAVGQRGTEGGVDRRVGQVVAAHHSVDIEAGAAAHDGLAPARHDV